MREFWEDLGLPICISFGIVFIFFSFVGIWYGIQAFLESKECKVWGGKYSVATGCLIEYQDKLLTLDDYKRINRDIIIKPIETNTNMNIKINKGEKDER